MKYLLILCLLLCVPLAVADYSPEFTVDINPMVTRGNSTTPLEFTIDITNNQVEQDTFRLIFSDDISWLIEAEPLYHKLSGVTVGPGDSVSTHILLRPQPHISGGTYRLAVRARSKNLGQGLEKTFTFSYQKMAEKPKTYVPTITAEASFPPSVDPREDHTLEVSIRNRNLHHFNELNISVTSDLLDRKVSTSLNALEQRTVPIPIWFEDDLPPTDDIFFITIDYGNETLATLDVPFQTTSYATLVETRDEKVNGFLKWTQYYTYVNEGNVAEQYVLTEETSFLGRVLGSASPEAEVINEDGQWSYRWAVSLQPGESVDLAISQSYRVPVIILIVIILVIALYFLLRSPVQIRKEAEAVRDANGHIKHVQVTLHLRNRTRNPLMDLRIYDNVPSIGKVGTFPIGTLQPKDVTKSKKKGNLIKWELPTLEGQEERVMAYGIDPQLAVVGNFTLPATLVKFKSGDREEYLYSNKIIMETR